MPVHKKRRRGRPRATNPRAVTLKLKLTRNEAAGLRYAAKRLDLTASEAIREALRSYGLLQPERDATAAPARHRAPEDSPEE